MMQAMARTKWTMLGMATASLLCVSGAQGQPLPDQETASSPIASSSAPTRSPFSLVGLDRDSSGVPGLRPRMALHMPMDSSGQPLAGAGNDRSAFSWSLEAWQLNRASLAHIQCNRASLTMDTYLARDCRFVDQPVPDHSVNLVQVRGEWLATPGLRMGLGAFQTRNNDHQPTPSVIAGPTAPGGMGSTLAAGYSGSSVETDGVDMNVSFGISTERVGDFLVGLQLARYRQRLSMQDLAGLDDPIIDQARANAYTNSAQLALGWRRGNFSGDLMSNYREGPLWLGGQSAQQADFNSFDLEFSWRPSNASISIGVSNLLDTAPRADDAESGMDESSEQVFGRIPYVRYKHDL